ncbi:MAG: amidase [Actinomycetota bacterium]|nr:amidase [Actinomycetota bacterium]
MAHTASVIARMTAAELVGHYADGSLSPVEVLAGVSAVIDEREPVLNALWHRTPESALEQAQASERRWREGSQRGPIDGVPVTLKENVARRGVPMPSGHDGLDPVVPERNSPIADRVDESGGVVVGSTVMPDWGMLSSGVSSRHGITRSPWNPLWTTGGSSSGAGAACAAGYAPLNVGTDIGGSIRLPGTWLGLATLKPSAGRVPLDAPYLGRAAGPMARSVDDAASFLSVLARPDARDWTALPPEELPLSDLSGDVAGLRVGLHLDAGCGSPVEPEVAEAVAAVADLFADAGASVEEVPPFMTEEMLADLDLFWRVRSWNDFVALPVEGQSRVLPFIQRWVQGGKDATGSRVLACYQHILDLQRATVAATGTFDVVLSPVAPGVAFPAHWPMPFGDEDLGMAHIGFTVPYNMSGQPAGTVNCGFTPEGKPVGVQLAGRRFDDVGVLRAMRWYELARPSAAVPDWPIAAAADGSGSASAAEGGAGGNG